MNKPKKAFGLLVVAAAALFPSHSLVAADTLNWSVTYDQRQELVNALEVEIENLQDVTLEASGRAEVYSDDLDPQVVPMLEAAQNCSATMGDIPQSLSGSDVAQFEALKTSMKESFERCEIVIAEADEAMSSELRISVEEILEEGFAARTQLTSALTSFDSELKLEQGDIQAFLSDATPEFQAIMAPLTKALSDEVAKNAGLLAQLNTVTEPQWETLENALYEHLDAIDAALFDIYATIAEDAEESFDE